MSAAWLAALILAQAAPAQPPQSAPVPTRPTDELLYRDAMQCKTLVEPLVPIARNKSERKTAEKALAFWTEAERDAGTKLGKSFPEMIKDELMFGIALPGGEETLRRALHCVEAAAIAEKLDKGPARR